ncbi:MAG: hypothetical protein M3286_02200 [Thermoproteota archaeon]|nr:hypothetical protein [Thermoproteota archaeon]
MHSNKILSVGGLNTLMFTDPYAKLCYTAHLTSEFDRVIYVDLDTTFTAYFNAGCLHTNSVDIYLPSEGQLAVMAKDVLESMGNSSLVIFDSVNSFYNLFPMWQRMGTLNHLLSVLIMLLVRRGVDVNVPVLATSMLRYRKERGWVQSPASRRLLQHKSAVKLSVDWHKSDLLLKIVHHESMEMDQIFVYKCNSITV